MGGVSKSNTSFYCGNKNFTFTLNLIIKLFFFNPFYIYIFTLILWDMKKTLKNELKLGFQSTKTLYDSILQSAYENQCHGSS
jgi:hypothetical protein